MPWTAEGDPWRAMWCRRRPWEGRDGDLGDENEGNGKKGAILDTVDQKNDKENVLER